MPAIHSRSEPQRNVLVAVAGHTPAIITETLWALEQQLGVRVDEIRVITTAQGHESIASQLLSKNGQFSRYCADYEVPRGRIAFSLKNIYLIKNSKGEQLQDIRDNEDNRSAADQIFSLIQEWTKRRDEVLFCSVAGGRKTLGIYLAMSLMICGRPDDTLTHVLVSPEFEAGVSDFYYPPPEPLVFQRLVGVDSAGEEIYEPISSRDAQIELADIPFPRLREALGGELPLEQGFTDAVSHSQLLLAYLQKPPTLRLLLKEGIVELGQLSLSLSRQLMAVYAFFLKLFNGEKAAGTLENIFSRRLALCDLERRIDQLRLGEMETYAWEKIHDLEDFRARLGPCVSKVNRAIKETFGNNRLAERCQIRTGGQYGVNIPDFEIFDEAELLK